MNFTETINFLKSLQENNSKTWMDNNRSTYLELKENWIQFNELIIGYIYSFDPSIGFVDPRSTLFRINRDIRFSHDKTPYNTHFSTLIKRGGKDSQFAGYYVRLDRDGLISIGAGLMELDPGTLTNFRVYLNRDNNGQNFQKLFPLKSFEVWNYNNLKRIPNEFKTSLYPEFMVFKSFVQTYNTKHTTDDIALITIKKKLKELHKFVSYVNNGVLDKI
jgi:uncharacterized protein (TIGR02453 family)